MDAFYDRLIVRAATIDELLSDDFETLPGQKGDADQAALRLAAWCRACASGDWLLFNRRLERDKLAVGEVAARFATVRRRGSAAPPAWLDDAIWIEAALQSPGNERDAFAVPAAPSEPEPCAFEHLLAPVVARADAQLWSGIESAASARLTLSARACLRGSLLAELADLCAPALYERFATARKTDAVPGADSGSQGGATSLYARFVADMKGGGWRRLFEDKPVLLRLIAAVTRQWIDTSREFVMRLDADLPALRRDILQADAGDRVAAVEGELSDPHNGGHSVLILRFEGGGRVVYKPKDLRLDVAWAAPWSSG